MAKPLFISWCPKDALDGMQALDPWEELAYRRTIDLLYCHDGKLPDDDERMGWLTKVGVKRWKKIKPALVAMQKLTIRDGFLLQGRVSKTLADTTAYISKQSSRAKRRWDKEKDSNNKGDGNATAHAGSPSRHMQADKPGQMPDESHGNAAAYAILNPVKSPTTTSSVPTTAREPGAPGVGEDRIMPVADEIWSIAGRDREAIAKRTSGNIDDFRHVRGWSVAGYTEDEILNAAKAVITSAGEIRSLWGLLAKSMPEALERGRNAPNQTASGQPNGGPPWRNRYSYFRRTEKWDPRWGSIDDVPALIRAEVDAEFGGPPGTGAAA